MRTIKFRGKRLDDSEWVYGYFVSVRDIEGSDHAFIHNMFGGFQYVIPDSVGQFTGLLDKNGTEIYEGDILIEPSIFDIPRNVFWDHRFMRFGNISPSTCGYVALHDYSEPEIIGNIHDNPELLKQND